MNRQEYRASLGLPDAPSCEDETAYLRDRLATIRGLYWSATGALGALGVIGNGYCFCSKDRDPDKERHEPECRDARAVLADRSSADTIDELSHLRACVDLLERERDEALAVIDKFALHGGISKP